ncbi:uncharacterized protein LOC143276056 [Babylonia areolata]|uniref:uncharacterized protein LOC143276056 n=1 Tax=Babylonia areolata TaxID=304850 RepID=UPI003FD44853
MLLHSDNKAFPCFTCDKTYKTESSLARHILAHTGLILSSHCRKEFKQHNLEDHLLDHSDNKVFCLTCGKTFKRKRY